MTMERALEIGNQFLAGKDGSSVVRLLDAGTHWICYGGRRGVVVVGGGGVKIHKETEAAEDFLLPDGENFELLSRAVEIPLEG